MGLATQQCNIMKTSVKVMLQQRNLPLNENHVIKWL